MKVERQHSSFRVVSDADSVELLFSHLRNGRDTLSAEVEVLTSIPSYGPVLLGPKQFNILSERTQNEFARSLQARCPVVADWNGLLTEACRQVLKAHRAGEPSVRLADVERPPAGSWLIPGFVLARMPVTVFGDGSAGKSLVVLGWAEAIQAGDGRLMGLEVLRQVNVLWLDWEFDAWEHRVRSEAMTGRPPGIRYRRMYGPLADQIEAIEREVDEHNIGLLVADSAAYACGGKPEDSEQTNRYFDALRRLNVGVLNIAHETKLAGLANTHDKPFGSVFWHNASRATWFVQKQQDEQEADDKTVRFHVGLFNKKTNQGRLWKPHGWRVEVENDEQGEMVSCVFSKEDVRDIEGLRESAPLRARIRHELERGPATVARLATELDAKERSVARTVQRMEHAREVVIVDMVGRSGVYGLAARGVDLRDFPE